jgi:hypothetical protein
MNKIIKIYIHYTNYDMPPNSSKDPKVGPRTKHRKKKRVRAHSLIGNISGVGGRARAPGWD